MYEYIIGKVTFISPYYIVVETNGIGFQISVGNPYRYSGKTDQQIKIYIHQVIREDAHLLYGFGDLDEKQLFLKLISVSGIGPKSGLAIMASDDHGGLINAIESEDAAYLTKFPGVGKKTAQQMVLDLKGKLGELETSEAAVEAMAKAPTSSANQSLTEALEALSALGYSEKEIKRITPKLEELGKQPTDEYLRNALKFMMKR
ncbi:Holliday junction ATP-dependent DNA helicase RuvA [Enterococcus silesiacus]|uniref:Holliday junction branch migration complex subunit RuvA n=1 Tax=Enterococcus silesiacus TaxID=332949 RepID=A0A0S3KEA1_9ENTE|nr:Holliday junction branch migration protein RuvA [Enterococcus silesiacus]ALS02562.1 Holliday junction ATP-dependent DNA helicase RuvA [Enterococcus silesiacus]OJG93519.1 Holliday junction ATP-dependent DNA helicase ruvA [Enterococcus silesiacus]